MPYLTDENKQTLKNDSTPKKAGDINYLINLMLYAKFKDWNKQGVIKIGRGEVMNFPAKEIAAIMAGYIDDAPLCYQRINDAVGACVCAIYEFIRRNPCEMPAILLQKWDTVVIDFTASWYERNAVDYEDEKIKQNGDAFPLRDAK